MNNHSANTNLFHTIIDLVVTGERSLYNEMMKKAKGIDVDYFENICRGSDTLSDELNLELKDKVVNTFSKMADSYFKESDLESRIVAMIQKEAETIKADMGENACEDFLKSLADKLEEYVKGANIHPDFPKYTNADVEAMYQEAKHVSLKEFFLGSNDQDILDFYNALMDNTWWACREEVVNKTNAFLLTLAMKTREKY